MNLNFSKLVCSVTITFVHSIPQFVSEGAERTLQNPSEAASVVLVVRVDSKWLESAEEWVVREERTVTDGLEHGLIEIELPEVHLAAPCELDYVRSVERADEVIEVSHREH